MTPDIFFALQVLFPVCALLWLAQVAIPWSSWLTAGAFTALVALHQERRVYIRSRVCAGQPGAVDMCTLVSLVCLQRFVRRWRRDGSGEPSYARDGSPPWPQLQVGMYYSHCRDRQAGRQRPRLDQRSDASTLGKHLGDTCEFAGALIMAHRDLARLLQTITLATEVLALPASDPDTSPENCGSHAHRFPCGPSRDLWLGIWCQLGRGNHDIPSSSASLPPGNRMGPTKTIETVRAPRGRTFATCGVGSLGLSMSMAVPSRSLDGTPLASTPDHQFRPRLPFRTELGHLGRRGACHSVAWMWHRQAEA